MKEDSEDKQIYVSGRIWHELYPKVNPSFFLYALRRGIDLSKYGDGIKKFYFTFIVVKPDDILNKPGIYFNKKTKEIEIGMKIAFEEILNASQKETIQLMEQAYLEGIELIDTLPLKSHFDTAAFKKDVQAIFSQDKWYELVMETSAL